MRRVTTRAGPRVSRVESLPPGHALERRTVAGRQIPAVVSYHPAYLLRRPTEKAAAWEDLQRVRAIAGLGN